MNKSSWRKKTTAKILTISRLRKAIRELDGLAIGLVGFSGSFAKNGRTDAESVTRRFIETMLANTDETLPRRPLFLISGATDLGVPRIGYAAAKKLGVTSVGVTSQEALKYSIAELEYLTVVGNKFGDESEAFVSVIDELWVIGGGKQSLSECNLASEAGVKIMIAQGIGGIADTLSDATLEARYTNIDQYLLENGG